MPRRRGPRSGAPGRRWRRPARARSPPLRRTRERTVWASSGQSTSGASGSSDRSIRAAASARASSASARSITVAPSAACSSSDSGWAAASERRTRPSPTAPPHQHAATPMPPHANPGRRRYQPGAPTSRAVTPSKSTGPLGTSGMPRATQASSCAVTPSCRRSTATRTRSSPACAVTRACDSVEAREHHGFVPVRSAVPSSCTVASRRRPGPSAAKTPQVEPAGAGDPGLVEDAERVEVRFDGAGGRDVARGDGGERGEEPAGGPCGQQRGGGRRAHGRRSDDLPGSSRASRPSPRSPLCRRAWRTVAKRRIAASLQRYEGTAECSRSDPQSAEGRPTDHS